MQACFTRLKFWVNDFMSIEKMNMTKHHWKLKIFLLVSFVICGLEIITIIIKPTLIMLCKIRCESLATAIASKAVHEVMNDSGYTDLITLEKDSSGNILALRANVIEMNRISSKITSKIQSEYSALEEMYVKIPIGNFTGNELLAGRGPNIRVKVVPAGTVTSDYKTEFISTGINQTRHRVYLEITSEINIIAPFINHTVEVFTKVNIAETVLIGNVPETFYNLQGIKDFTVDDTMNMM